MKLWPWKKSITKQLLLLHLNASHLSSILNQCWKSSSFCDQNFKEYNNTHNLFAKTPFGSKRYMRQFTLASLCFVTKFVSILPLFQTIYIRYKGKILKVIKSQILQPILIPTWKCFIWVGVRYRYSGENREYKITYRNHSRKHHSEFVSKGKLCP